MEGLREELNNVIDVAGNINGVHKRVAEKMDTTVQSIYMITNGQRLTKDKPGNRKKLEKIIELYKDEIRFYNAKQIEVIL